MDKEQQAQELSRCFKASAWNQLQTGTSDFINALIKVYLHEDKKSALQELNTCLTSTPNLKKYINERVLTDLLTQNNPQELKDLFNYTACLDSINPDLNRLMQFAVTCFIAHGAATQTWYDTLLRTVRLDQLFEAFLASRGYNEALIGNYINCTDFKAVLAKIQDGIRVTQEDIKRACTPQHLNEWSLLAPHVAEVINVTKLNEISEAWKNGHGSLRRLGEAVNVDRLEVLLGIPVRNAFSTAVPLSVQEQNLQSLQNHFTNKQIFNLVRYGLPLLLVAISMHILAHTLCHSCVAYFERFSWTGGLLWASLLAYLAVPTFQYGQKATPVKIGLINALVARGQWALEAIDDRKCSMNDIMYYIPKEHPHAQALITCLRQMKKEHLSFLPSPYTIIDVIIKDPKQFIMTYPQFIFGITQDPAAQQAFATLLTQIEPNALSYINQSLTQLSAATQMWGCLCTSIEALKNLVPPSHLHTKALQTFLDKLTMQDINFDDPRIIFKILDDPLRFIKTYEDFVYHLARDGQGDQGGEGGRRLTELTTLLKTMVNVETVPHAQSFKGFFHATLQYQELINMIRPLQIMWIAQFSPAILLRQVKLLQALGSYYYPNSRTTLLYGLLETIRQSQG